MSVTVREEYEMPLQAVIIERIILSALITVVAAIAACPFGSSITGFGSLEQITPLAQLEGLGSDEPVEQANYTLSQIQQMNIQD
jgi:hypothetical protein